MCPLGRVEKGYDNNRASSGRHGGGRSSRWAHSAMLARCGEELVAAAAAGQLAWASPIAERLDQFDYSGEVVCRWWPRGRAGGVAIDPRVGLGMPVVAGSGVPTWAVRERSRAGEPT